MIKGVLKGAGVAKALNERILEGLKETDKKPVLGIVLSLIHI